MVFDIWKVPLSCNCVQYNWKVSNVKSTYWSKFLVSQAMLQKGDRMMHAASHYKIPYISVGVTAKASTDYVKLRVSYSASFPKQ